MRLKNTLVAAGILLVAASTAFADTSGDHPLTTSYTATGNVDGKLLGAAFPGVTDASSSFTLAGLPGTATIQKAYLYTNSWFASPNIDLNFNSTDVGVIAPTATDDGTLGMYRWDVTSLISGNGAYAFNLTGGSLIYGASLAVVYSDPSLALNQVQINDGSENLANATSTTFFNGFSASSGTLSLFTEADDNASTGEQILFNGNVVGGPIDQNLGPYASLFALPVSVQNGSNSAAIVDGNDQFGWHVAMLSGAQGVRNTVPEPSTLAVFGIGALGLLAAAMRRRRSA